ncbi:hypothetical protein LY76DRAFT_595357 [Colletotrichum caudatum]|nr:hypothetical protein LY76DRAFT_595357 [Colletotrichum caudatum]
MLTPLYQQALHTQWWAEKGSHVTLWDIVGGVEYLLEKMEMWKTSFDDDSEAGRGPIHLGSALPTALRDGDRFEGIHKGSRDRCRGWRPQMVAAKPGIVWVRRHIKLSQAEQTKRPG